MQPIFGDQTWIDYNKALKKLERARKRGGKKEVEDAERQVSYLKAKLK